MTEITGYTFVGGICTADYSWTAVGVWRQDATGRLFYATDSGCSCSEPLDSIGRGDLTPLTHDTYGEFEQAVRDTDAGLAVENEFLAEMREEMGRATP